MLPSVCVQTLGVRNKRHFERYQHFRGHGSPYGLQDALSTLHLFCSSWLSPRLRHRRKTRYGWVATPYPTRTFTLQETPNLSWRENAALQARGAAAAQRRLFPSPASGGSAMGTP